MKSFLLHEDDGEPAACVKTDELHAFLHPICDQGTPHDFDGGNHGLTVSFVVHVGDTMIMRDDNSFRVLPKDKPVAITRHAFPMTHMAMLVVEHDNGAHHVNRIAAAVGDEQAKINLEQFDMPYAYGVDKLVTCENALYALMRMGMLHAFEEFVTGEQSDQDALIESLSSEIPDLSIAHKLLNDWFNGWEDVELPKAGRMEP